MSSKFAVYILLALRAPFLFVKLGMPFLDPDEGSTPRSCKRW